jgi:hypothetical protein
MNSCASSRFIAPNPIKSNQNIFSRPANHLLDSQPFPRRPGAAQAPEIDFDPS